MSNAIPFLASVWWALLIAALIGLFLGWLFFRGKKVEGDLSVEGEGALRAEADSLRARVQELEGRVSTRDTEISGLKEKLAAGAVGAAAAGAAVSAISATGAKADDASDDDTYALEWRNRYLAARVKYLESQIAEAPKTPAKKSSAKSKTSAKAASASASKTASKTKAKPKAKAAAKPKTKAAAKPKAKAAAKPKTKTKTAAKTAESKTRKKPGPKPGTKRGALTAAGKPRKKPGPKAGSTRKASKPSEADAAFEKYYTNVKKYDPKARKPVVQGIVKYCGVALKSRDASLVACSDEAELKRVADGFVTKKLEKSSGQMDLVKEVCQDMKGERFKNRVTFYYLAAKKARKLGKFT